VSVVQPVASKRTPAKRKARQLAATLRQERPDYAYLKEVFRQLRTELGIVVPRTPKRLPYVPTEDEIRRYYETVWKTRKPCDLVLIKILLYTGVRVSELVDIRLVDVDFDRCQIRINEGKGRKDRVVPFPSAFKETLALHHDRLRQRGASYLFESSWKKPYSDRGVRRLLERYATAAGLAHPISPHRLRHFLLTWLKKQGIDDALIQPYSGHASRKSLEIYSQLAIGEAQLAYDEAMPRFPV
jgi:integrase/recombinase XerD